MNENPKQLDKDESNTQSENLLPDNSPQSNESTKPPKPPKPPKPEEKPFPEFILEYFIPTLKDRLGNYNIHPIEISLKEDIISLR